jgi:TetR/AcrR family transcriptional regulator, copper-responsive repressor
MVQKTQAKRGRPRAYDPDTALARAMAAFWDAGYTATSLDDLSAATGMNRPSLYGAFGDKRALYLKTLAGYRAAARAALKTALAEERPLPEALRRVYAAALGLYLAGDKGARGCFLIGTAATQAVLDPAVRAVFADGLHEIDAAFAARIHSAQERGELRRDADPAALARIASAILHTLALRARAGENRAALEATAEAGIALICGGEKPGA